MVSTGVPLLLVPLKSPVGNNNGTVHVVPPQPSMHTQCESTHFVFALMQSDDTMHSHGPRSMTHDSDA